MEVRHKVVLLTTGLVAAAALVVIIARQLLPGPQVFEAENSGFPIPVFPGSALEARVPAQGEVRYLSFRSPADPEEIRRYFSDDANLSGWSFTGRIAGNTGMILQDGTGRRMIIDIKAMSSCLLSCQQYIHYWLAEK